MVVAINRGYHDDPVIGQTIPTPLHSPEWWRNKLNKELDERQPILKALDAYYRGEHPLPLAPKRAQEAFRRLMHRSRSNWMALVVDAVAERLGVEGFRYGRDETGDRQAWRIWQANGLDLGSEAVHLEALINGESAVTVAPNPDDPRIPLIVPEHPCQVIVARDPSNHRSRPAAFKKWLDDSGRINCTLYLPEAIYKWQSVAPAGPRMGKVEWTEREVVDEDWPLPNPLGEVPVVPFRNAARMLTGGTSEIAGLTDIQDRINKTLFDRLMAAEYAAFRQRWATGFEIPDDPQTGQPKEPFESAVDRLWVAEDKDVKFGEFNATDLAGYIKSVEADIQHLAAISRTPPHYLLGQSGAFPSGESLKSTETGLVAKVMRRQVHFGESWEEVMRLAFKAAGDDEVDRTEGETIWRNPESRTLGELTDALLKMKTLGAPDKALWREWGLSPQKIEQWEAMSAPSSATSAETGSPEASVAVEIKAKADALGALIRAGVDAEVAAQQVGLPGLKFTGATPVSLRLPEDEAAQLEDR